MIFSNPLRMRETVYAVQAHLNGLLVAVLMQSADRIFFLSQGVFCLFSVLLYKVCARQRIQVLEGKIFVILAQKPRNTAVSYLFHRRLRKIFCLAKLFAPKSESFFVRCCAAAVDMPAHFKADVYRRRRF